MWRTWPLSTVMWGLCPLVLAHKCELLKLCRNWAHRFTSGWLLDMSQGRLFTARNWTRSNQALHLPLSSTGQSERKLILETEEKGGAQGTWVVPSLARLGPMLSSATYHLLCTLLKALVPSKPTCCPGGSGCHSASTSADSSAKGDTGHTPEDDGEE